MNVIHLSVECYPVAKVGGLADVVGALPKYQRKLGIDASVVMPWYNKPYIQSHDFEVVAEGGFYQGSQYLNYIVYHHEETNLGFSLYLIKIPGYLDRSEVYGYEDDSEQWLAFQHAFLHWILTNNIRPDVINCHDHHVGLIPFLLKNGNDFRELSSIKTLFTIHNGQYQGWMNWSKGILLPGFDTWKWGLLDWSGSINPLSSAVRCCDAYSTVSEGYLGELVHEAKGLESLFVEQAYKSHGIVNGIDPEIWNPSKDPLINSKYNARTVKSGKRKNKEAFCENNGISSDGLLLTYIGRFAHEKGADILASVLDNFYSNNENKLTIFILGSGDSSIQQDIENVFTKYAPKIAVYFGYNEALAHEAYAASDVILMPSRVEPCGLNQLYALKYGTIPVVRGVGGLKDTVLDVSQENGYGFVFNDFTIESIVDAIQRALAYYSKEKDWSVITRKAMSLDFSWEKSAQKYIDLYNQLLK
ncbi:glycogen synthase [Sphingobacterium litopenaei]|uniref:Glycogen synthase n=1 Tax=Sphingobacterium litopenaei TaxID=2763500 RepID=A0ABR7YA32_9SPHI|nr:glycogen/starch synthase [Sphingobacterium litopenaei]MBD1428162.1 glycogen/starch synthase [Sphingobacterium litopenaei]